MRRSSRFAIAVLVGGACLVPLGASPALAGGGCHAPQTEDRTAVVVLEQACFGPTITRVPTGTKVTWTNKDPMAHVVAGVGYRWGSMEELQQGDRFSTVFRAAGVYPYTCYLHPGMNGAVVVGGAEAPELAAAGSDSASDAAVNRAAPEAPAAIAAQPASTVVSAGAWPAVSAVGFGLASVLGVALILMRRRLARPSEDR
ncbi:MAG TPA: plastocyanin/azurin family copper-binding protein [Actinomycetota bacterium]|nr:plastocyanin/azurin family copper-binding protein [Actinomycetota bacterium]